MQSLKLTPMTLSVALLAGCGGSEVDTSPTPLATMVDERAGGGGVASYITSENLTGLIYHPHSIQNEIDDFNEDGQSSSTVGIDLSQSSDAFGPQVPNLTYALGPMLIEDSDQMRRSEQGDRFFDQEQNTLLTFQEIYGDEITGANGVYATQGPAVSNAPYTGTFAYEGAQFFQSDGSTYQGIGTFDLSINFNDSTFVYSGTSQGVIEGFESDQIVAAEGQLNSASGIFTSENATIDIGATTTPAELTGILHGNGATAVTGLFTSTEPQPNMIGAFIGSKQ